LRDEGYAYADVLIDYFIPSDGYGARVTLDIEAGPVANFGEILVEENRLLDEESVRRMLPFRQGSLYRRSLILEGQRNLYSLDIIQTAAVEELRAEAPSDTVIPVRVRINEGDLHRVRTGLGWTTADCMTMEATWASRNFRGGARRLEARARLSNILAPDLGATACPQAGSGAFARLNGQLGLELVQPWIISPRNSLTAGAYVERQSLPDVFVREALGFSLALRRNIGRRASLTLSYQPQLARLEAAEVFFCASFLACLPSDIRVFQAANWLAPVGLGVSRDRRNSVLNPSGGNFTSIDLEHAAGYTGSNFEYTRVLAEATTYLAFGTQVAAARLRAGVVGRGRFEELGGAGQLDLVHPQKRFYAGGANSVRGFAENRLGPRVLTADVADLLSVPDVEGATEPVCLPDEIELFGCDPSAAPDSDFSPRAVGGSAAIEGNLEVRFPLSREFQGVTFLDFGNVWLERGDVSLGDLEFAPGVGVRYFSPIGPIRVDIAYRFREGESLPVATSGVRAFDPDRDQDSDRIVVRTASGAREPIPWVRTNDLTFLFRDEPFGGGESFFSRLQLHFSIGQAF
jgi:outer membrane protein insertion porin family/translocation and assembly module TamA